MLTDFRRHPSIYLATMSLTNSQCKYLRGLGHALKPVVYVGGAGLTEPVLAELDGALQQHELIKIRMRLGDRTKRDGVMSELLERSKALLVQRVGNVALLYREAEEPKLTLPRSR